MICGEHPPGSDHRRDLTLHRFALAFSVSSDEEFVQLALRGDGFDIDLGDRAFLYVLLTLARRRVVDAADGVSEQNSGWIHSADLRHDLKMDSTLINLHVHRARRLLLARGVRDGAGVVERRVSTRELRIGTSRLAITKL